MASALARASLVPVHTVSRSPLELGSRSTIPQPLVLNRRGRRGVQMKSSSVSTLDRPKELTRSQKYTIATLPGDGQGPEVMEVAKEVLSATSAISGFDLEFEDALIGKVALKKTGSGLPEETLELCKKADGVLLGGISTKLTETGVPLRSEVLSKLRDELGLFWQISPAKGFAELKNDYVLKTGLQTDINLIREISGGLYTGKQGRDKVHGEIRAYSTSEYTISQVERIGRAALEIARQRSRRLTSVDVANYLEVSKLWREVLDQLAGEEYPDVELTHELADSFAGHLITVPDRYDVVVLPNLLGDVLVEAARGVTGGTRMAPQAWLGEKGGPGVFGYPGSFEGDRQKVSNPDGIANPLGLVRSASMLLRYQLGLPVVADLIQQAITAVLADGYRTVDMPASESCTVITCAEMGDRLVQAMEYFQKFKVAGNPIEVGE